ncbi:MAG: hypothetical protein ACREMN_01025 [Gemmatimonadales bacterium]
MRSNDPKEPGTGGDNPGKQGGQKQGGTPRRQGGQGGGGGGGGGGQGGRGGQGGGRTNRQGGME